MNDDQLSHELNRRAESVSLDSDWAQRELLPAVGAGISASQPPSRASRMPAFVGLAAAAVAAVAVVAVLVFTFSRLGLDPSGSRSTSPTVIPTLEFASRLATGELDGQTVLVRGRLVPYSGPPLYGLTCTVESELNVAPPADCLLGEIEGAQRLTPSGRMAPIYVDASYVRAGLDLWRAPGPPIDGVLVLEVDHAGSIRFLGRMNSPDDVLATVDAVRDVSPAPPNPFDVHILQAWLYGSSRISCPPQMAPRAGFPGRICDPSWLVASPTDDPNRGLRVQSRAFAEIGEPDPPTLGEEVLKQGTYVVASRLEADMSCPTVEPCWQWEVIAKITDRSEVDGEPVATLTPTPNGPTERPTPQSESSTVQCTGESDAISVVDRTGFITACRDLGGMDFRTNQEGVTNPEGDRNRLLVHWVTDSCVVGTDVEFLAAGERYTVSIEQESTSAADCGFPVIRGIEITLGQGIGAFFVDVVVPPARVGEQAFDCTGPPRTREETPPPWPLLRVSDETGLVVRCEATRELASVDEPLLVTNPSGDTSILELTWSGVCVDFQLTLRRTPTNAFELIVFNPTPFNVVCDGFWMSTEMRLYLSEPIDRGLVSLTTTRAPEATPLPRPSPGVPPPWEEAVECDGSPSGLANGAVRIADHTGLVTICQLPDSVDGDPGWLPDMAGVLQFSWETPCASDTHRTLLEFWRRELATDESQRTPYVLLGNRIEPDQSDGLACRPAISTRTVELLTNPPLAQEDVEFLVIAEEDAVDVAGSDEGMFHLSMSATKTLYNAVEQVDVAAALRYGKGDDALPMSGMSVDFSVEQLDGSFMLRSGPTTAVCVNGELRGGEPRTFALGGNLVRDPYTGIESYYDPDPFVLPRGVYRVHVDVRFVIGDGCTGESVALQASTLVRVE